MIMYPQIDPVLLRLGPFEVHWYGMMYMVGFTLGWWLGLKRAQQLGSAIRPEQINDMLFYAVLGVVLGGRFGYVLFYDLPAYLANPLSIFKVWQGGMSFHGGLIGVLIAMWLYARQINRQFFEVTDFIAPLVPLGLAAGRVGNFINGELWGRPTDMPWGMVFPMAGQVARHPSQLYQMMLEGIVLFMVLWFFSKKSRPTMAVSGVFLIGYALLRSFAECFRSPDVHIGFIAFNWLTMGQLLCVPMLVAGIILVLLAYRKHPAKTA